MPSNVLEREIAECEIFSLEERGAYYQKPHEVQKRLQEFCDSGHLLDPTALPIFTASAHNENPQTKGILTLTQPNLFGCPEGITLGELFNKKTKTFVVEYEKTDPDAPGKVDLVPKERKMKERPHTLWKRYGFKQCTLTDILDFLPQLKKVGCNEILIITEPIFKYETGYSLLVLKKGEDGKFCLFRIKYDSEYQIEPTDYVLFRSRN